MIKGIGIDAVEIERFQDFRLYPKKRLSRLFSQEEIIYCLREPLKSAERFAGRFAAKEALYKALTQTYGKPPAPFLKLCSYASITLTPAPHFIIEWEMLELPAFSVLVTITHTKDSAFAQVIIQ